MVAEVVALRYYRAVRDGSRDRLASDVAGRILADELRHVPFHRDRLRESFRPLPGAVRVAARLTWWTLMLGACAVVVWDHGPALRRLGVTRTAFAADVTGLFATVVGQVFHLNGLDGHVGAVRTAPNRHTDPVAHGRPPVQIRCHDR
ncbi:hypothetical protein ACFYSC_14465 [Streptosporangium sp. NPDC004379]|uniref:hypothetical protein n=1 Tax=Streptosporangium sp. NPDC004379 TaxID=3366189 RepID=UPI00367BF715